MRALDAPVHRNAHVAMVQMRVAHGASLLQLVEVAQTNGDRLLRHVAVGKRRLKLPAREARALPGEWVQFPGYAAPVARGAQRLKT